jgi:hypothetical protein
MTSPQQLAANRRNATRSTGPRSARGKEKSRLNSLRHGLSSAKPIVFTEEMEELYQSFWSDFDPDGAILAAARAAVIADFELRRVRLVRRLLNTFYQLYPRDRAKFSLTELARYERYERRAFSKRNSALIDLGRLLGELVGTRRDHRTR